MDWTNQATIANELTLTALPARHFSGRGLLNRFQTLWSSFAIRGSRHNIYYGADSGWHSGFAEIGQAYGPFDLTMLEIGASSPFWTDIHMGPIHAAEAHLALQGKLMMPIHWGTFNLALHAWNEPIQTLLKTAAEKGIQVFAPQPGEPTMVTGQSLSIPGGSGTGDGQPVKVARKLVVSLPTTDNSQRTPSYLSGRKRW